MKLSNLFLASLAICTMASCSKDEDGPSVPQEMDAYLSIAATSNLTTRASVAGDTNKGELKEQVVNTLTAYVFTNDAENKYVIHKTVKASDEDAVTTEIGKDKSLVAIKGIHVKVQAPVAPLETSETSFKVVLLANTTDLGVVADLNALKAKETADITGFTTIGEHFLPMHSNAEGLVVEGIKPYDKAGAESGHLQNWYKTGGCVTQTGTDAAATLPSGAEEISLYRSITRVQIESLVTNFTGQYKGATFKVGAIYLANVRETATVMGEENSGAVYYRGAPEEFEEIQKLVDCSSTVKKLYLEEYDNLVLSSTATEAETIGFSKYIYANKKASEYQTRLILEGNLIVGGEAIKYKYFHIPLADENGENVVSNKIYKISATITGEGNDKVDEILDNACINFKIKVEDWEVVEQNEEDLN